MKCNLCERCCNIERNKNISFCNSKKSLKVARYSLHHFEEPPISGDRGSGTVFFSGCNLKCIYCQNQKISRGLVGKEISIDDLSLIFIKLQKHFAHNINLVTPTHYVDEIIKSISIAKERGLNIPIIYNTSSYESVSTLEKLNGLIDVYLPDFKYYNDEIGYKYSFVKNYVNICKRNIKEMYNQVGPCVFDSNGLIKKGVIVRHLVLPGLVEDSKKIIKYLYDTYHDNIYISIMRQYTPVNKNLKYKDLNRCLTNFEYDSVVNYAISLGIENAFIQDEGVSDDSFIPEFDDEDIDFT